MVPSRERARDQIAAGRVTVGGAPADKPSRLVAPNDPVVLAGPPPRYVSRGGGKLEAALDRFGVPVAGRRALDAGASTGGFTDCLLQRGAASVVAVDVGHGDLHHRLRGDPRVRLLERTNVRHLTLDRLGVEPLPLLVADLAFISLRTVAPTLVGLTAPGADLVLLVKPQFEARAAEARRHRGVIRDPRVWAEALHGVGACYQQHGVAVMGVMASPLLGAEGNVEFLVHMVAGGAARPAADDAAAVALAVAGAPGPTRG